SVCGSSVSSMGTQAVRSGRGGRPISAVFSHAYSPSADMHLAQIEEELDTIIDHMGLQGEQRLAMKSLAADRKMQLIHTHKAQMKGTRADATPLSEHLKILGRAGTQSLPRVRLEKLRVDVACQSMTQIHGFIEGGGLRLLVEHLAQLNERRTAARRTDELLKELELLRCILGVAKVDAGAASLEGHGVQRILDSLGTMWLPCAVMALRIVSYLVQQDADMQHVGAVLAPMFRRSDAAGDARRRAPFVEWMEAVDGAVAEYDGVGAAARADVVDFVAATLAAINGMVDALAPSLDRRVKLYEKLAAHGMLERFQGLRAWRVGLVDSHLNRWDEALRRDYNIARSQRGSALVLEGGVDSAVRSAAVFKSFIGHYEAMRAAQLGRAAGDASDGEDEFMRMNLATCSASVRAAGAAVVSASAPVTPRAHERARGPGGLGALPATNPFFAASPVTGDAGPTAVELPFVEHSRSSSSIVAETGCLRSSSSIVAETGCLRSLRSPPQT
ncbi:hypothetical protein IWW54_006446, partial [Coemansia sp. RSA 2705]